MPRLVLYIVTEWTQRSRIYSRAYNEFISVLLMHSALNFVCRKWKSLLKSRDLLGSCFSKKKYFDNFLSLCVLTNITFVLLKYNWIIYWLENRLNYKYTEVKKERKLPFPPNHCRDWREVTFNRELCIFSEYYFIFWNRCRVHIKICINFGFSNYNIYFGSIFQFFGSNDSGKRYSLYTVS